jgi:hypothetical protein
MGQVTKMSQTEEKEENVNTERAIGLFKALSTFFKQDPKGVIDLVHEIAEGIVDTVTGNGELSKELGFSAGQLKLLSHLFWYHDDKSAVQHAIADPENLENIIDAIAQLAEAYNMLKTDGSSIGDIKNLIERAVSILYEVVEFMIGTADCDP